jgi:DNA ligase-1
MLWLHVNLFKGGENKVNRQIAFLKKLSKKMNTNEIKYTIRLILKSLRIGGAKSTALEALSECLVKNYFHHKAWYDKALLKHFKLNGGLGDYDKIFTRFKNMSNTAKKNLLNEKKKFVKDKIQIPMQTVKKWVKSIKKIFSEFPDPEEIILCFLTLGNLDVCARICKMRPGIPCSPMLAKPTRSADEALAKLKGSEFTCELKYDGLRGQVHVFQDKGKFKVQIFSRNLENLTPKYPALVNSFLTLAKDNGLTGLILDGEVMATDTNGKILPFQTLMTKKGSTHKIAYFAFDILYKDGVNLMDQTFKQRRTQLKTLNITSVSDHIKLTTGWDISSKEQIMAHLLTSVEMGGEGLMIKNLGRNSEYIPSNRSAQWLKLKKDYIESHGLGDSFDLTIMGAISGEGKRKGLFGSFLVGCYNSESEKFETCCMVGTGFNDKMLKSLHTKLSNKVS